MSGGRVRRFPRFGLAWQFASLLSNLHRVNSTSFLYHVQLRIPFEHILRVIVGVGRVRERTCQLKHSYLLNPTCYFSYLHTFYFIKKSNEYFPLFDPFDLPEDTALFITPQPLSSLIGKNLSNFSVVNTNEANFIIKMKMCK